MRWNRMKHGGASWRFSEIFSMIQLRRHCNRMVPPLEKDDKERHIHSAWPSCYGKLVFWTRWAWLFIHPFSLFCFFPFTYLPFNYPPLLSSKHSFLIQFIMDIPSPIISSNVHAFATSPKRRHTLDNTDTHNLLRRPSTTLLCDNDAERGNGQCWKRKMKNHSMLMNTNVYIMLLVWLGFAHSNDLDYGNHSHQLCTSGMCIFISIVKRIIVGNCNITVSWLLSTSSDTR